MRQKTDGKNRRIPCKLGSKVLKFKEVHFKILLLCSNFTPVVKIAKILKKSHSTVSEHVSKLIKEGYLNKEKELTFIGRQASSVFLRGYDKKTTQIIKIRAHNLTFKCLISSEGSVFRDGIKKSWIEQPVNNWNKYIKHFEDGVKVHITPKSVLFYLPELIGSKPELLFNRAMDILFHYKKLLETKYPGLVLGRPECIAEVQSNHLAFMWDKFAKLCAENHITFKSDEWEIDCSHGIPETEAVNKDTARDDARKYFDLINDVSKSAINWKNVEQFRDEFKKDKVSLITLLDIAFKRINYLKKQNDFLIDFIGVPKKAPEL